jgi:hypothetical protein
MHHCTWKGVGKLPSLVPVGDCYFGLSPPGGINLLMHKDLIREENTSLSRVFRFFLLLK